MEILSSLGAVGAVFALLAAVLFILRRRGLIQFRLPQTGGRERSLIEVMERRPLDASHTLIAIRCEGRRLLVATFPGGCTLLESAEESRS